MNENREDFTNPLPQKAEYDMQEHLIYGKQKTWKKVIDPAFLHYLSGLWCPCNSERLVFTGILCI